MNQEAEMENLDFDSKSQMKRFEMFIPLDLQIKCKSNTSLPMGVYPVVHPQGDHLQKW